MTSAALKDRVAIVLGSATGIGAACARTLAARGAIVILADIAVAAARETAAQIVAAGGHAVATRCDVSAEADVAAAVGQAETEFGRLNIVHNNAAAMHSAAALAGELTQTAYGVSKAAAVQLTRSVATQYGRQGIRCNAILPGFVKVERQHTDDTASAEFRQSLARNHLTPYIGEPQDIANVVAFLAGDDSRFVTGHLFSVDGGLSAHQGMYADLVGYVA
jgi:NAD(P)-dependent dehydrogenase (short-subunit alcohol dehydrogenase family)